MLARYGASPQCQKADGSCSERELSPEERTMPASASRPAAGLQRYGRLWWLPSGGQGNGLDDAAWAPILEVSADVVTPLLAAFRAAGVPAYAASIRPAISRRGSGPAAADFRVWVGSSAYGRAVETLITVLPALTGQPHARAGDARP
jgi:hypothetical protein